MDIKSFTNWGEAGGRAGGVIRPEKWKTHKNSTDSKIKFYIVFIFFFLRYSLGVASKQLRLLHGRVGDSTTVVNSLSFQMSELVEDAIASWCGDIVGHFWLSGMVSRNLSSSNLIFSVLTLSMSLRYFGNELYKRGPNTVIAFSWRDCAGFLFVGYWITHCVPSLGCFLVFIVCQIVPSIFGTICCVIFQIYIII